MAIDLTNYGNLITKEIHSGHIKSGFKGGSASTLQLRAGAGTSAANNLVDYIEGTLTYGVNKTSTLEFTEYDNNVAVDNNGAGPLGTNLLIKGLINPSSNSDASTKKYVDDKIIDFLIVKGNVKAVSDGSLTSITNGGVPQFNNLVSNRWAIGFNEGGPVTNIIDNTSCIINGATIAEGDSVLFLHVQGGGTADVADGVYVIDTIQTPATPNIIMYRRDATPGGNIDNMIASVDNPLEKGNFVLVSSGAIYSGNGYYLNNTVTDNDTTPRNWLLFSTSQTKDFAAPITQLPQGVADAGKFTVTSSTDGSDEGKVLISNNEGDVSWSYTVGKSDQTFNINSGTFNVNNSGAYLNTSVGTTITVPKFKVTATEGAYTIALNHQAVPSNSSANMQYLGKSSVFAETNVPDNLSSGGTPSAALSTINVAQAKIGGHATALTSQFTASGTEDYGAGVLFNNLTSGGTNDNQNKYLICPHKHADDTTVTLDVLHFGNGNVNGSIIAQLAP